MKFIFAILVLFFACSSAFAQPTNTTPWPNNPPVGIGTQLDGGPLNALHIHYNPHHTTWPAMLRLSQGDSTASNAFGLLGLMPAPPTVTTYSHISSGQDLILHENEGDLILTNFWNAGGAIRMATTPNPATLPLAGLWVPSPNFDIERVSVLGNGNVGIDLPPDTNSGLAKPLDQLQIGGGMIPPLGDSSAIPGLTIYGGNRFEGMLKSAPDTGRHRIDWRYISSIIGKITIMAPEAVLLLAVRLGFGSVMMMEDT